MAFGNNQYMKIWEVADKGNYSEVSMTSSKKNRQTGNYETDFSSKFVRFVKKAHDQRPMQGQKIKITECAVQNVYEKDGQRQYLKNPTYIVFGYELQDDQGQPAPVQPNWEQLNNNDDLPF